MTNCKTESIQHEEARKRFKVTDEKQTLFGEVSYAADSWDRERRVIVKAEHLRKGANPRYVVASLGVYPAET